jgi:hypothetical protein
MDSRHCFLTAAVRKNVEIQVELDDLNIPLAREPLM